MVGHRFLINLLLEKLFRGKNGNYNYYKVFGRPPAFILDTKENKVVSSIRGTLPTLKIKVKLKR